MAERGLPRILAYNATLTPEQQSEKARKMRSNLTSEDFRKAGLASAAARTPEQRIDSARRAGRLGGVARAAAMTPEQRLVNARKASHSVPIEQRALNSAKAWAGTTPEQRSARAKKASLAAAAALTTEQRRQLGQRTSCLVWNIRRGKPCTCGHHELAVAA